MSVILIVDDERAARFGMKKALAHPEYILYEAEDGEKAWAMIQEIKPDLVFLDLNMPGLKGMELLRRLHQELKNPPLIIVVTAYGSEKIAVEAIKKGAYDYLAKPYEVDELRIVTQHAIDQLSLKRENQRLREEIRLREGFGEMIGESKAMQHVYDIIDKVAPTDVTVLLEGENGTGKELVAREIHRRSQRVKEPLIAMNCAALPENLVESELFGHEKGAFTGAGEQRKGKLEEAHGGTLFLDEIGDMTPDTQAKILRVLQDRTFERLGGNKSIHVDVRFIAATNKDLQEEIEKGNFREDLYYRIKVVDIHLPPLRERLSDIPILLHHFIKLFAGKYHKNIDSISAEASDKMLAYHWPGNVRQLKNVIEKGIVLSTGTTLNLSDLPAEILQFTTEARPLPQLTDMLVQADNSSFKDAKRTYVREFERQFITEKLKAYQGNISQTAQALDMPRQSLQQKLKELGISAREVGLEEE
jgi:two-component system response regulator AtoC/two-component system nitrogen regulation response regulator NtrX